MEKKGNYLLALDASTKTVGIALFDLNTKKLVLLTHVSPVVKPQPESKMEELFKKVDIFENEFLNKYKDFGIKHVIIEEALLGSNNIFTVGTLLKFNGILSRGVYDILGVVPEFISSYEARKNAFPELMAKRRFKKDGTPLTDKEILKNKAVLFGDYHHDVDKKEILWNKVSELEPQINWLFDKSGKLKKESFDLSDAYVAGLAWINLTKENTKKLK